MVHITYEYQLRNSVHYIYNNINITSFLLFFFLLNRLRAGEANDSNYYKRVISPHYFIIKLLFFLSILWYITYNNNNKDIESEIKTKKEQHIKKKACFMLLAYL